MKFHEFRFEPIENESLKDLLLGELMELGFESYAEEEGNACWAILPQIITARGCWMIVTS